jgi:hypothetical protein
LPRRPGRWSDLSPAYRSRLKSAGIGAREWKRGDSLRAARGHSPNYPAPRERARILGRLEEGQGTRQDVERLEAWRESRAFPSWARRYELSTELALRAQQAGVKDPSKWESAQWVPARYGEPWTLEVVHTDGTVAEMEVPSDQRAEMHAATTDIAADYEEIGEVEVVGTP